MEIFFSNNAIVAPLFCRMQDTEFPSCTFEGINPSSFSMSTYAYGDV